MYFVEYEQKILCYCGYRQETNKPSKYIYAIDLTNKQLKVVFEIPQNISQNNERIHIFCNNKNLFILFRSSQNLFKINQNNKYKKIAMLTAAPNKRKYISIATTSDAFLTIIFVIYLYGENEIYWMNKNSNKLYKSTLNAPCTSSPLNTYIHIVSCKNNEKEKKLILGYAHENEFTIFAIIGLCCKYYCREEIYLIEPTYDENKKSQRIFKTNITNIFKNKRQIK